MRTVLSIVLGTALLAALPVPAGAVPAAEAAGSTPLVVAHPLPHRSVRTLALASSTAATRGADLVFTTVVGGSYSGCQRLVHVGATGIGSRSRGIGCTGFPRSVRRGIRITSPGDTMVPVTLWGSTGRRTASMRASSNDCFTSGGETDWRLLCSPLSPTSAVTAYGGKVGRVRLLSSARAPRQIASVPYLAGGVVSHDSRTLYAWASRGADVAPYGQTSVAGRNRVTAISLTTGRQRVLTTAATGYEYALACVTWGGSLIAMKQRRVGWNAVPVGVVTISSRGLVRALPVTFPLSDDLVGCTADGRVLLHARSDGSADGSTWSYDVRRHLNRMVLNRYASLVDNA